MNVNYICSLITFPAGLLWASSAYIDYQITGFGKPFYTDICFMFVTLMFSVLWLVLGIKETRRNNNPNT